MAARDRNRAFAVRHVVRFARDVHDGRNGTREKLRGFDRRVGRVAAVDSFSGRGKARERTDFAGIPSDDGRALCDERSDDVVAPRNPARRHGIEHPGRLFFVGGVYGEVHGSDTFGRRRADVDQKTVGDPGEGARFLRRHDHGGGGAGREQDVRRDFLHDVVREDMHERAVRSEFFQKFGEFGFGKVDHGAKRPLGVSGGDSYEEKEIVAVPKSVGRFLWLECFLRFVTARPTCLFIRSSTPSFLRSVLFPCVGTA